MITPPHLVRSQDLHSTSVGGDGADPKVTQPLSAWIERGSGTSGDSAQTESCPNAGPDTVIRSRKRYRYLKTLAVKRSRPPMRRALPSLATAVQTNVAPPLSSPHPPLPQGPQRPLYPPVPGLRLALKVLTMLCFRR